MPWATLADEIDKGRNRTMALTVIAAIAVGILAFLVVRSIRQPPGTVIEVPTTGAVTAPAGGSPGPMAATTLAPPAAAVTPSSTSSTSPPPAGPAVYSEADLLAGAPDVDQRLAEVRAEWFVSEYFSTGGIGEGLLAGGITERTIPDGAYSWVEWARAVTVETVGGGRYDVTVVFRTIAGDGERPVAATPVRAVSVPVQVGEAGASGVVDLPSPVAVPGLVPTEPPPALVDVPEAVSAAAREQAVLAGGTAVVVGGTQAEGGWRVVVAVTDRSGASFPVVVPVGG